MPAIEGADAHGKGNVIAALAGLQLELFGCDLTSSQPLGRNQLGGRLGELRDRLGRTVDCQYVPVWADPVGDLACRGASTAANPFDQAGGERGGHDHPAGPGQHPARGLW